MGGIDCESQIALNDSVRACRLARADPQTEFIGVQGWEYREDYPYKDHTRHNGHKWSVFFRDRQEFF